MELYQLRSFVMVAETGNLTQAAERLFTSQPAVSAHIKALEEELSIQLFHRSAKGMRLTENGEKLKTKAMELLDLSQGIKNTAKALQDGVHGNIHIGLNSDVDYLRLTEWHKTLVEQYPNLTIELVQDTSSQLISQVRSGYLDCTFFSGQANQPGLTSVDLLTSRALVAGGKNWQQQIENASIEQLAELPWIQPEPMCVYHHFINELFNDKHLKPKNIITSAGEESTLKLLLAGAGLAVIRDDEAKRQSVKGNIVIWRERSFKLPLRLGYLQDRQDDPRIQALCHHILSQFALMKSA